jgi:CRP-like cAMP-binding protein/HEAT repeat protein
LVKLPVLKAPPEAASSRPNIAHGSRETVVKGIFLAVYFSVVIFGFFTDYLPTDTPKGQLLRANRIFWTMALPLVPFFMVAFGYYVWRRMCPISMFAKLGARLPRTKQRRVPPWFERWGYMVIFGTMFFSLGVRLLFINGSGMWLSIWLLIILASAFITGVIFTGKTWCNFLCPIAIIEKVYTEPTGMGPGARADNSQCKRCTACKRHCPDIDVEMGYWKEKDVFSRRMATYGWPGLVFAFYFAYWLYKGHWGYYFDGTWTREPHEWRNIFGPGFFFAPFIPKIVAVYLSLLGPTVISWLLFFGIERLLTRRFGPERGVHYSLSLAAFTAFNVFYIFAGQPTWRKFPGGAWLVSFVAVMLSTWFFMRRFGRREDEAVQERFAKRFVARWQWKDEKPPEDLREAFYVIKRKEQEKEVGLRVYADTIRELLSEGVLTRAELRIIEQVRAQFNISDQDHEKVLSQLQITDRQLFDPNVAVSAEDRLQEQGYRVALRTLLLRGANKRDIDNLRREYGIAPENHQRIVDELTGKGGGHRQTVEDLLARIEDLRAVYRTLCGFVIGPALEFLSLVLLKRQDRLVDHALDVLSLMGLGDVIRQHRPRLFDQDKVSRSAATEALHDAGDAELMERFVPILEERVPSYDPRDIVSDEQQERVLDALASEHDPFVRAGSMLASALPGETPRPSSIERLLSGMNDEDALVREAAIQALPTGWGMAAGNLLGDTDRSVRDAAQAAVARRVGGAAGNGSLISSSGAASSPGSGPQTPPLGATPPSGPQIPPMSTGPQTPPLTIKTGPQPPLMAPNMNMGAGGRGPQPPNMTMGAGGRGPQPPNMTMGAGGRGPQPPNLNMGGPQPPNMSAGPQPPNMSAGPQPPNMNMGGGPHPLNMNPRTGPQLPPVLTASTPSPSQASHAPGTAGPGGNGSMISKPERMDIGEGFGGPQADTMVTGRFAVPRLPTNLGPVCTNLERILFLHCVPLFVDFEPEDLLVLARASEERGYTEGTVLFNQGDVGDEVFVIISGRVQTVYAESGGERTAQALGPGDCIGEMSVIDGSLRSTTAVVTGVNTRVLAIAGDTFRRFVEERAHVSGKIIGVLASRLRQVVERTARPHSKNSNQPSAISAEA